LRQVDLTADDLCYLTAREALNHFARGSLSPVDLMSALLNRIEAVNPRINAFGDCYFDEAQAEAREAERRWRSGTARALEGIPVAVKDAQNVAGQRTTYGSPAFGGNYARTSDPMIERLLASGAIIHARTTVSEFCMSGVCASPMWGTTRNPWNLAFSPGGSSGGSGAALAAGMAVLATGTDMGGSIRVPASACAVVGYKPPHGRNPDGHPFNLDRLNHCGALARSVGDIALVQNIVAGPHPKDGESLPDMLLYPEAPESIAGLRIAWSPDLSYRAVDPEVLANTERALRLLEQLGCTVQRVQPGWSDEIDDIAADWYRQGPFGQMLLQALEHHAGLVSPDLQRLGRSWEGKRAGVGHVLKLIEVMSRRFDEIMQSHDVFICPTMSVAAVKADQSMWDADFKIDGRRVDAEFGYSLTHQFNLLGHCPAISIPSGQTRLGLPTGLQIVGKPFDDLAVIRTACAFQTTAEPWFITQASRPDLSEKQDE
jgi:Asp-tRNA(Asn)/Glu-tRNA(Gln) amidotransferase A subunit family amidase